MNQPGLSRIFNKLPLQMNFTKSHLRTSAIFPFFIGFAVGVLPPCSAWAAASSWCPP